MNVEYFRRLYDYNYAAHRRLWQECILPLSDEQFARDLGYSLGSVRGQVVHVMGAEWLWLSRLQGESPTALPGPEDYPTRDAIRARWDEIEALIRRYMSALRDEDMLATVEYRTTSGQPRRNARWEILAHVVNHGTDHRAQILAMIHQLGGPTFGQDMIGYLRGEW